MKKFGLYSPKGKVFTAFKKGLIIMKITLLLILISSLNLLATGTYSQTAKVSINLNQTAIKQVLKEIEKSSEFYFLYNNELVDVERKVDIVADSEQVNTILDRVFSNQKIKYAVYDRQIVISPAKMLLPQQSMQRISGKVTDSSGATLPGVSVVVKGTTNGVITDNDGKYSLANIPENAILQFSFVGMKTQEIAAGNKTTINVLLTEEAFEIKEVVAIGYGTIRKSDLTSAISKVDKDVLAARPVAKLGQALQGQMAGVQVQQSNGKPGENASIKIRGVGSISAGSNPLYVVDGFPVDGETFTNLGSANIESIEVLKDAASASIYGSRGSGGVIIVTTKRGQKGHEMRLDINAYTGIANIERKIDMLNGREYAEYAEEIRDYGWQATGGDLSIKPDNRGFFYGYYQDWKDHPENIPNYDHFDAILQTGITRSYSLNASGSTKNARYMISGEHFNETGIIKNTNFKRYSFRSNIDVDLNKFLTVGLNIAPTYIVSHDKDTQGSNYRDALSGTIQYAFNGVPVLPPRLGMWGESDPFGVFLLNCETYKSIAKIEQLKDEVNRAQILVGLYAQVKISQELSFKTTFGANYSSTRRDRFENQIISRTSAPQGMNWNNQTLNVLNENIITYDKTYGKHHLNAILGFTAQKQEDKSSYIKGSGFANDYVPTLNAASAWNANTLMSEWSLLSYLGRINYSFFDKYLINASLRTDGSSRFGSNNKWGQFPSVSVGWRIDKESFFKENEFIKSLKLRASLGKTGNNNIGNYSAIGLMGTSAYLFGVNETKTLRAQPSSISNPNLNWEKTTTTDIGIDLGLFNKRISLSADYFNSQTTDVLLSVPIPSATGFKNEMQNYGKVENKGWEFELSSVNINRDFKWTTDFNLSLQKNKVKQLGPNNTPIIDGIYDYKYSITKVGYPIGSFYMLKQIGIYNYQKEIDASAHVDGTLPGDIIIEDYHYCLVKRD